MSARPSPGLPAIVLDRKGATPLYRQIYESYRTAILDRRLRAGQRMPSTRALADELGLSRIPVLNAFEQLIAEGYLEARTGAGTYVSESLPLRERAEKINCAGLCGSEFRQCIANNFCNGNIIFCLYWPNNHATK